MSLNQIFKKGEITIRSYPNTQVFDDGNKRQEYL